MKKTVKLCIIFVVCQKWSLIENVNFCKNSARATISYVKHLHLWRRMSCQACVQLVKVGQLLKHLWTNALDCVRYCNCSNCNWQHLVKYSSMFYIYFSIVVYNLSTCYPVSYTHLTLPTILRV